MFTVMKIAIQGEPGSFSHEAATKFATLAQEPSRIVPFSLSEEVFSALMRNDVDAACIPDRKLRWPGRSRNTST